MDREAIKALRTEMTPVVTTARSVDTPFLRLLDALLSDPAPTQAADGPLSYCPNCRALQPAAPTQAAGAEDRERRTAFEQWIALCPDDANQPGGATGFIAGWQAALAAPASPAALGHHDDEERENLYESVRVLTSKLEAAEREIDEMKAASPAAQVTEAMVEEALTGWFGDAAIQENDPGYHEGFRVRMRAALTAALAAKEG